MPCGEGRDARVGRRARASATRAPPRASPSIRSKAVKCARIACASAVRVDRLAAHVGRLQHLQVAARQQRRRVGDVAGVAGELHAVFGRAERGRADAFAGRQQRPRQRAARRCGARIACPSRRPMSPKSRVLAAIDVFADAAREHDAVDARRDPRSGRSGRDARPHAAAGARLSAATSASAMPSATRSSCGGDEHVAARSSRSRPRAAWCLPGRVEPHDAAALVDHLQAAADVHGAAVAITRRSRPPRAWWCRRRCRC